MRVCERIKAGVRIEMVAIKYWEWGSQSGLLTISILTDPRHTRYTVLFVFGSTARSGPRPHHS